MASGAELEPPDLRPALEAFAALRDLLARLEQKQRQGGAV
jgi:hypothetical protein